MSGPVGRARTRPDAVAADTTPHAAAAATFTAFLDQLDRAIAPGRKIHVVLGNGSSHTARHTKAWPAAHPCWHVRKTPAHASWLHQVELSLLRPDPPSRTAWRLRQP